MSSSTDSITVSGMSHPQDVTITTGTVTVANSDSTYRLNDTLTLPALTIDDICAMDPSLLMQNNTITINPDLNDLSHQSVYRVDNMANMGNVSLGPLTGLTGNMIAQLSPLLNNTTDNTKHVFGDTFDVGKQKIYIVEPWQSRKPIMIDGGLYVSFEEDLISTKELKEKILNSISETHPEITVKIGLNPNDIKLVKNEVTIEIKKDIP